MLHYGDYQMEIYRAGLNGRLPKLPVDFGELEERAHAAMPPGLVSYVAGGCGNEHTQSINVSAFERWGLIPRMFVGAAKRDMSIDLFGMRLPTPIFMSSIGVIGLCAQDGRGDIATARAARKLGVPMVASTLSNNRWKRLLLSLVIRRASFSCIRLLIVRLPRAWSPRWRCGLQGIVVTGYVGDRWRPRDLNQLNFPMLRGHALANYFLTLFVSGSLAGPPEKDLSAAIVQWGKNFENPLNWDDLPWLRSLTKLPLIMKGICHPDDAGRAIDVGVDGIYCSNHGGRQANGGIAAVDLLPGIVKASGNRLFCLIPGYAQNEVIKALALGATAVGIGRPYATASRWTAWRVSLTYCDAFWLKRIC